MTNVQVLLPRTEPLLSPISERLWIHSGGVLTWARHLEHTPEQSGTLEP